jgi:hypothetical protein
MEGSGETVGIYAEAKLEYTRQLSSYLVNALHAQFLKFLDDAKQKEPDSRKVLLMFQQSLEQIPEWNYDKVQRETHQITVLTECDYLEELLTAVFIAHTKVLSAIRLSTRQKKLQITIPKLDHFLHKTYIECARILWSNAYLFASSGSSMDRQKNQRIIEQHIQDGVSQAIRAMLPVKSILKEYLRDEDVPDEDDDSGKPQPVDIDNDVKAMESTESLEIEGWQNVTAPAPSESLSNSVDEKPSETIADSFDDEKPSETIAVDEKPSETITENFKEVDTISQSAPTTLQPSKPVSRSVSPARVADTLQISKPLSRSASPARVVDALPPSKPLSRSASPARVVDALPLSKPLSHSASPAPNTLPPAPDTLPPPPTIIVETSPSNVTFTNIDAVYDSENVNNTVMKEMDEDMDGDIEIMDEILPMDDFETL